MSSRGAIASQDEARRIVTFLTYADDRNFHSKRSYVETQGWMTRMLEAHPNVLRVIALGPADLLASSLYRNDVYGLLDKPLTHGGSGNSFKPFFIDAHLASLPVDEYLLYHDCSPEIWNRDLSYNDLNLEPLLRSCSENGGILVAATDFDPLHTHESFTDPQCMGVMGLSHMVDRQQHSSAWVLLQNTPAAVSLVKDWLHFIQMGECSASLPKAQIPDCPSSFHQNRGDQSVLSVLLLRDGYTGYCHHSSLTQKNVFCGLVPGSRVYKDPQNVIGGLGPITRAWAARGGRPFLHEVQGIYKKLHNLKEVEYCALVTCVFVVVLLAGLLIACVVLLLSKPS